MERSVGQSVSDTINQFKRLKDDPVNAAKALDNELHFLTATQLEQIRVLGEQGRSSDAARIAMSALAEETGRRTADIDNNLNALGSTLKYLSDLWSRFWDAAMNIGREDSLDEQISALQEKVSQAKRLPWTASSSQVEYDQQRLNELQEKKRQKDLQDAKEQAERNYQEQQKRRNAENAALNRMNETEAARHQREIARINAMQYADQAVRDAAIQRENERYEKALASGKKKTREPRNDEATRLLLQYSQQQAQVEGQIAAARQSAGIATERMTEAHKQLLALQQRISDLDGKKLTADEKSVLARKMETFHWKVRPDMNVVSEPKVVTVKLGDGYEQRRAAGLNNQLSTYSVTIRVRKCEHPSLKAFLERHGGVRAFQWTPPYDWKPIRVVCRKWSASVGALWVTITADFEQVVA